MIAMAIGANKTKAAVIELSLVIFVPSKSYVASEYEMRALRRLDARKQKNLRDTEERFISKSKGADPERSAPSASSLARER